MIGQKLVSKIMEFCIVLMGVSLSCGQLQTYWRYVCAESLIVVQYFSFFFFQFSHKSFFGDVGQKVCCRISSQLLAFFPFVIS